MAKKPIRIIETRLGKSYNGWSCDETRRIEVDERLTGKKQLETFIHETIHIAFPFLYETTVEEGAAEIASVLWRVGYRRQK